MLYFTQLSPDLDLLSDSLYVRSLTSTPAPTFSLVTNPAEGVGGVCVWVTELSHEIRGKFELDSNADRCCSVNCLQPQKSGFSHLIRQELGCSPTAVCPAHTHHFDDWTGFSNKLFLFKLTLSHAPALHYIWLLQLTEWDCAPLV